MNHSLLFLNQHYMKDGKYDFAVTITYLRPWGPDGGHPENVGRDFNGFFEKNTKG